jgi:hypothetical protein
MHRIARWGVGVSISFASGRGRRFRHHRTGFCRVTAGTGAASIPDSRKSVLPCEGLNEVLRSGVRETICMPNFVPRLAEAETRLVWIWVESVRPNAH